MNLICQFLSVVALVTHISCQYGINPRIFFIPSQSSWSSPSSWPSSSSSSWYPSSSSGDIDIARPFLIPGPTCNGLHLFTRKVLSGTCQDYLSCVVKRRYVGGPCAFGLKTCCIPKSTTHTILSPSPPVSQTYRVHPYSNQYCQLRLDFDKFVIGDPVDGTCQSNEQFTVSGQKGPVHVPTLCGQIGVEGWNQHMYLEFDTSPGTKRFNPITLKITTSSTNSKWTIRATQIMCNDLDNLAPTGCLQFYNTSSGDVRSFNYRDVTAAPTKIHQLNRMDYKVCLNPRALRVTWTKASSIYAFSLSGQLTAAGVGHLMVNDACTTDYAFIRGGSNPNMDNTFIWRSCGTEFQDSIVSTASPLSLQYHTDIDEPNSDVFNNGFHLKFSVSGIGYGNYA